MAAGPNLYTSSSESALDNKQTIIKFATLEDLNTAISRGQAADWESGQEIFVSTEPYGFYRIWNGTDALTVVLPNSNIITLAASSNTILATNGTPSGGNSGDYAWDKLSGIFYGPKSTTWSLKQNLFKNIGEYIAYDDFAGGTGQALSGRTTPVGGKTWSTGGAGYLTAVVNDGYIVGTANTYCHLNLGEAPDEIGCIVNFPTTVGTGTMTVASELLTDLADMVHCNLQNTNARVSMWITGTGTDVSPFSYARLITPSIVESNLDYEYRVIFVDDYVLQVLDGVLIQVTYDTRISTLRGNYIFVQLHDANKIIKKVWAKRHNRISNDAIVSARELYGAIGLDPSKRASVYASSLFVSNTTDVGPKSPVHIKPPIIGTDSIVYITQAGATPKIRLMAESTGYGGSLRIGNGSDPSVDTNSMYLNWDYGTSGGKIGVNSTDKITFPAAAVGKNVHLPGRRIALSAVSTSAPEIIHCTGSPEAQITAAVGSWAFRDDAAEIYYKATGTGNTGWVIKVTA